MYTFVLFLSLLITAINLSSVIHYIQHQIHRVGMLNAGRAGFCLFIPSISTDIADNSDPSMFDI